jgi:ATP-dependent Lhr-like helicase
MSRLGRLSRPTNAAAGRWSLVPAPDEGIDHHELAEVVAEQLLNRWGVVFRDLAIHDDLRLPWRDIQWALRRLEDRGLVRGGRFVSGFSGEQYALPTAVEQLNHVRKQPRTGERVVVHATDPLNLVGLVVPGATVAAVRTNHVVYVDGIPTPPAGAPTVTSAAALGVTPGTGGKHRALAPRVQA